jgi:hypothetical protein
LVLGVLYKLFSGTFSHFFRSQTKLTNLRSASLILENLKHDLRLATVPTTPAAAPKIERGGDSLDFSFQIKDQGYKRVTYRFDDGVIKREVEGGTNRTISRANVASFSVDEGVNGTTKFLSIAIEVDAEAADLSASTRSSFSKANRVVLRAIMFPRFFADSANKEEEYWARARAF